MAISESLKQLKSKFEANFLATKSLLNQAGPFPPRRYNSGGAHGTTYIKV
jgi:hypothetical protein